MGCERRRQVWAPLPGGMPTHPPLLPPLTPPTITHGRLVTQQVYAELRRESSVTHGMPIAVRHLESMIRMSEARASMHLREYVNDDDIDNAIRWVLDCGVWVL